MRCFIIISLLSITTMDQVPVPSSRHILRLSKEEKETFADSFDLIINDCDGEGFYFIGFPFLVTNLLSAGVVWSFTGPLEGAKEGLAALKSTNKRLAFVSNNSFFSKEMFEEKFSGLELDFNYEQDLLHPAAATVTYLQSINFTGSIFLIGSDSFRNVLEGNGFKCISMVSCP